MTKPRVNLKCVASHYAAPDERIIEFGDGADGTGGLIAFRRGTDGRLLVNLYRLENVTVQAGASGMNAPVRHAPGAPQDIPFWPDYMHRELAPEHRKTWCLAQRLTERHRRAGHTLAIHPKKYARMEAAHAAEVRAAVTARLQDIVAEGLEEKATPAEIVAVLLEDPAVRIMTDHNERRLNGRG